MKRRSFLALLGACGLSSLAAVGCSQTEREDPEQGSGASGSPALKIVCTSFSGFDWVREVLGDNADACELSYLLENGADMHSFQPTVDDIAAIRDCDLFIYVGGESEEWARELAEESGAASVCLLDAIGSEAVEEELVEGMQEEEHEHEEGAEHEEDPEYDEHVWLSLHNADTIVEAISQTLAEINPDASDAYLANAEDYRARLAELDQRYRSAFESASSDTLVFADRFPFRYLVDDYGLNYYAAFVGCSAETEASFETVRFLAEKVDELELGYVCVIEGSDERIARTVIDNTNDKNQQVLIVDSLQSVAQADIDAGKSFLSTMEDNLSTLAKALG